METGLIQMNKKKLPLIDTVISAVNRTYPKADEKEIEFVFDYEKELETCTIMQDKRWLGEAVINVLLGGYARRQTGKFCTRRTAAA